MRTASTDGRLSAGRIALALAAVIVVASFGSCGERGGPRYAAERELFKARKVRDELLANGVRREFVEKAVEGYRKVVTTYGPSVGVAGVAQIVISAQMELAELEFRAGMPRQARDDFEEAVALADSVPAARANAIYSAAFISEELGERSRAFDLYDRFLREYLGENAIALTAAMNKRYLVTPLKLAALAADLGRKDEAARRLEEAARLYRSFIDREKDETLVKEARFDLLTAYLQGMKWSEALALVGDMKKRYGDPADASSLSFIEAKVREEGLRETARASGLYMALADAYPKSREAPMALLHLAAVRRDAGDLAGARTLYARVIDGYGDRSAEAVEAEWQTALLDERAGSWDEASLRFKSIYARYPETIQGFEAPLRLANSYRDKGEADAAEAAYTQALEHYEKLIAGEHPMSTKIMAEQYAVRTLIEERLWSQAIARLTRLPDRYPDYTPFRGNCLRAASIYERELHDTAGAARVLGACATRYAGSEFAEAAERELARMRGGRP